MRSLFERRAAYQPPRTVLISSHLLNDLERVVTHVAFLRQGRLQLMDGWDALAEHVRLLELPARASVMVDLQQGPGVLHRREKDGRARVLFDARVAIAPPAAGHALGLDDLFAELNA
jgi:ABC-2 type transport system ATP-binding protein